MPRRIRCLSKKLANCLFCESDYTRCRLARNSERSDDGKSADDRGGYAALDEEIKRLKGPERQRIIKAIAEARAHGDLSENAEYHAAKEQQSHNEGRVMELEDIINRADVIDVAA